MKKTGLIAGVLFFAAAAFAQTTILAAGSAQTEPVVAQADTTKITTAVTIQMQQLDSCIRNYSSEKSMAKRAMMKGDFKRSKADYAVADADKKYIKTMAAQLKSEGVRHPLRLAHKEIKRADKKMIMADIKTIKADKLAKQKALRTGDTTAVKLTETNLIADKSKFKKDINTASHDDTKHIPFIRLKS